MNHHPPSLQCVLGCVTVLLIASCSSSNKSDEPSGATSSGLNRFMDKGFDRKKGQFDTEITSQFDQKNFGSAKKVKEQQFKTDSFAGKHEYAGSSDYKSKEFTQSGKESKEGAEKYAGSSKTSQVADKSYDTKESREGGQEAGQGSKSFADGNQTYQTTDVRDAAKSQKKNVKPEIRPAEDEEGKSAYSEADVKRMVNRN
jgi:hypothetical protein